MKKKIMILDGNSILFRAFYAMPPLKTKKGQYTNAVYGFLTMMYKLIDDYKPEYICVAFDPKKPTFRHEQYSEYKAGRAKAPDELVSQFQLIRDVLKVHNIKCVEIEGFEADDVAGTMSKESVKNGMEAYLVTSDKDYLQLISEDIKVLLTKKGATNVKIMDSVAMLEDYGITPEEFIDLKALMGDQSDNIPGVLGVGEKTAVKLIKEYHNLDNLYENIDSITGKLKEKLENDKMQAYMSKMLATIVTDIPVDINFEEYKRIDGNSKELLKLYDELEFRNFKKRINILNEEIGTRHNGEDHKNEINMQVSLFDMDNNNSKERTNDSIDIDSIDSSDKIYHKNGDFFAEEMVVVNWADDKDSDDVNNQMREIISSSIKNKQMTLKILFDSERALHGSAVAIGINTGDDKVYIIHLKNGGENDFFSNLKDVFSNYEVIKNGHGIKSEIIYLLKLGIELNGVNYDAEIGKYLLNPSENSYSIDKIAYEFLQLDILSETDVLGTGKSRINFKNLDKTKLEQYLYNYICVIVHTKEAIIDEISKVNMKELFYSIEMPLVEVLANMEFEGFKIDTHILDELGDKFNKKLKTLELGIFDDAGEEFNINSPKQLGVILFEKLNLEVIKKTKTGYSTDVEVLEKLRNSHPIVEKIIEYRQLAKLNSTYIEGLKAMISSQDGRVHSVLNQTVTTTGRISSTEPNLQNIPTRTEEGKDIRRAFVAKSGCKLVDADYSQIELRVLAVLADEKKLIEAFESDEDIHSKTASEVFNVSIDKVTPIMRRRAKAVNFGIIYGISDFGLSRDLDIPRKEAKEYIANYLNYYENIDKYMKNIVTQGKKDLYVETYFGRRRYIPELESRNFNIRAFGERVALNTPIQGTAADIIKIAMIKVYNSLKKNSMKSKLLLQVHDELIVEAYDDEIEQVKEIVKREMENVISGFKVHLDVDLNVGDSWYESK